MSHHRSTTRRIFHYVYNTVYVVLCLVLAALILISPADIIRQTLLETLQLTNIVIIAIAYLVTVLIVLFIYSLRLYVTRTVLASIPKKWIPTGKGDANKGVREMISKELSRSAAIAWEARPKVSSAAGAPTPYNLTAVVDEDVNENAQGLTAEEKGRLNPLLWHRITRSDSVSDSLGVTLPPTKPVWGNIDHPGWGSPDSPDLANIQYSAVMAELPNLIEGKAMSLASSAPDGPRDAVLLDLEVVELLQRTGNMTMRTYVGHLVDLGVLESSKDVSEFLDVYEKARFSTRPMSVDLFRRLMQLFAQVLRSAKPLDREVLETMHDMDEMYSESGGESRTGESVRHSRTYRHADIDDDAPQDTTPTTPARSFRSFGSNSSSKQGAGSAFDPGTHSSVSAARNSSLRPQKRSETLPMAAKRRTGQLAALGRNGERLRNVSSNGSIGSGNSSNSFAQTRRPYAGGSSGSDSHGSSMRSFSQGSGGSVIRLATLEDGVDLPYVLRVSTTY